MDNDLIEFLCSIFLAVYVVTAPVLVLYILPCIAIVEMRNTRERAASQAHKRTLELMDKQIEMERVLRMPLVASVPEGVLAAPDIDTQRNGQAPSQDSLRLLGEGEWATDSTSQSPANEEVQ